MSNYAQQLVEEKRIAIYIRVSTHWQIDKDSLPVQREQLVSYAKLVLGSDNYEIFEDAGYSAKNTDRPAYQRMMARVRTGEFSHILVYKIDRMSRNLLDFATMYQEIKKLGVSFISKTEQFDSSTAMGEAMMKIILVFAELERNMTSERVSTVMLARAEDGKWNGGRIPYGYDYDKNTRTFSVNQQEAAIVELIYNMYDSSRSLVDVARKLNEKGMFPRSGKAWNPTTVRTILTNPFYTGTYRYNKHDEKNSGGNRNASVLNKEEDWIWAYDHHPAIIDEERQQHIASILEVNRRGNKDTAHVYVRKNNHIFAGLLFCGYCGSQFQCTVDRKRSDGYRPSIYACSRKRRFDDCENKFISDITVGPFVFNYISNIIKAQNNFGKSTSISTFEKKLLRGDVFANVDHVEAQGLKEMYDMLRSGVSDEVYRSRAAAAAEAEQAALDERDLLSSEKRKKERALARLKALFLYDENGISEVDFILEKRSLEQSIDSIDKRLEEIEKNSSSHFSLSDEEFMAKASTFIVEQELQAKRFVDFDKMVRSVDPKILKEFANSVLQKIVVKDGKIMSIRFKNGIEHKFLYKASE